MLSFNPLTQRDFFSGPQAWRNGLGQHAHGRGPQPVVANQSVSVGSVQTTLTMAYEKMQSVVQSRLQTVGATAGTVPVANDDQDYSSQAVADRIVGFVADRLAQEKAKGASDEKLMDLYQQALQGAEKGLREGRDIIAGQGMFDGDVKSTFYDTVNKIADGLEQLGKTYFGDAVPTTPTAPTTPTTGTGFQASLSQVQMERTRSFEMEVVTQEGDRVKILVNSGQSLSAQQVNYADDNTEIDGFEAEFSSFDNLSFTVEGDLNEAELASLNDLFGQVNDVAETFYGGNIEAAFNQAMDVGMDPEQLASFAVNMNQTETVAVRSAYASVQNMGGPARTNPFEDLFQRLGDFASQVQESNDAVASIESAIENLQSLYTDLLTRLHPGRGEDNGRGNDFQRFMNRLTS